MQTGLDPDQAQRFVGPAMDLNCLTLIVFLKEYFEKLADDKNNREKLPSMQRVSEYFLMLVSTFVLATHKKNSH